MKGKKDAMAEKGKKEFGKCTKGEYYSDGGDVKMSKGGATKRGKRGKSC